MNVTNFFCMLFKKLPVKHIKQLNGTYRVALLDLQSDMKKDKSKMIGELVKDLYFNSSHYELVTPDDLEYILKPSIIKRMANKTSNLSCLHENDIDQDIIKELYEIAVISTSNYILLIVLPLANEVYFNKNQHDFKTESDLIDWIFTQI